MEPLDGDELLDRLSRIGVTEAFCRDVTRQHLSALEHTLSSLKVDPGANIQSTGVVDRELIGNYIENRQCVLFALYGTWEALGGCNILPLGVGTIADTC